MKKALIIIDIQNDYFKKGAMELVGSEQACINTKLIIDKYRNSNLPVIFIQHIAGSSDASFFKPNSIGVEIHESIKPKENEKLVVKHYPNSFRETDLLKYLKEINVSDLVFCGMMTHMCVDTSVRAAYDLGFNCILIGDACATKDLEYNESYVSAKNVQLSYLSAINGTFAKVMTADQYLNN